jgi:hypothetical protein
MKKLVSMLFLSVIISFLLGSCFNQPEYPEDKSSVSALVFGNGKFIAGFGWAKMSISYNGIDWVPIKNPFETQTTSALAYGNGVFVAGSKFGALAYSNDGENWFLVNNTPFGKNDIINTICYGENKFIAGSGYINPYDYSYYVRMAYSVDGINWSAVSNTVFERLDSVFSIVYGDGKFISGGGSSGKMASSIDGIKWQSINVSGGTIFSLVYGNGKFIFGNINGEIFYSPNGLTWEKSNNLCFNKNESIRSIAFGDETYLAAGGSGSIAYSTDGIEWYKKNHNIDTYGFLHTIYANGIFLVGDWDGKITIFELSDFYY